MKKPRDTHKSVIEHHALGIGYYSFHRMWDKVREHEAALRNKLGELRYCRKEAKR